MEKYVKIFVIIGCFLLLAGTANAQYLAGVDVLYDARYYSEFVLGQGPEAYSGGNTYIYAGVIGYDEISDIHVTAQHKPTGFTITLLENNPSCAFVGPSSFDQSYYIHFRASNRWIGKWKIKMQYTKDGVKYTEKRTVIVPRFNYPPAPTGIQIVEYEGKTYLVWNRIGDPGVCCGEHVEYRVVHYTPPPYPPYCINAWLVIRLGGDDYELWSGNRIAVPISGKGWNSGDVIRIENRVYDDNPPDGPYRMDRACKYIVLP